MKHSHVSGLTSQASRFTLHASLKRVSSVLTIIISLAYSQEIPGDFFETDLYEFSLDNGENWETHTIFGSPRYPNNNTVESDSLIINARMGMHTINGAMALFGFGHFTYSNHFYGYLYPRIVNDVDAFPRYSGIPRDISRKGFSSGETDLSGIGFENDWLMIQWGRGREDWGAGSQISLPLNEYSPAYDYGALRLSFNQLRVKYMHGFLESLDTDVNRYITARGIEYTNKNSFLFGLSEIVIYSGVNRPVDLGYLNPMSTHLEIELNERLNSLGTSNANAVWQASLDWMVKEKVRISGNFLFDEFVIDDVEKDAGKEHGLAYSARIATTPIKTESLSLTTFMSHIKVGTPTFRHGTGSNNFVVRQKPLGWIYGSDGRETVVGINLNYQNSILAEVGIGLRESGEESITSAPYLPYEDYLSGPFPSGEVQKESMFNSSVKWKIKSWARLDGAVFWAQDKGAELKAGIFLFFPKRFIL